MGEHQLAFERHGFSRFNPGRNWFGLGHGWRHSYQYEMVSAGKDAGGKPLVDIFYPDGTIYRFTLVSGVWKPPAACPDRFFHTGDHFYLQQPNGWRHHFLRFHNGDGTNYCLLQDFTDSAGNVYQCTHDADKRLVLVSEPAGRWIKINYQSITANESQFAPLAKITATPASSTWTEIAVNDPTAYRYLRYYGATQQYCNVAEIEFYDEAGVKITGTPFGSSPASGPGREFDKATDGNTATSFAFAAPSFGFTGLDLGAGNAKRVSKVRFYPRGGYASRMLNGLFSGSNEAAVTQTVIASVETSDGRSVSYQYNLMDDAVLATDYVVLSEAAYGDGTAASYTYVQTWAGVRPVLSEANDPRYAGPAVRIKYEYWFEDHISGNLKAERNAVTGSLLAQLDGTGGDSSKVTYAGGRVVKFKYPSANASQITEKVDSLGRKTTYSYGSGGQGLLTARTNALGQTTSFTKSVYGNLLSITHADGSVESWTRDSLDLPLTHTDELGRVTTYTRDAQHRITHIDLPDGSFELFTYNNFGQPLTQTMRNGGVTQNTYDARGLNIGYTDPLGNITTFSYDAFDRLASVTNARTHVTAYEYNERGLLTKVTNPDASTQIFTYDTYGSRLSKTDELGHQWTYTYDEFKRVTGATNPLGQTTTYSYAIGMSACGSCHSDDKPTLITSPGGSIIKYTYDLEGQKTSETVGFGSPEAATTTYGYDAAGSFVQFGDPLGNTSLMSYDVDGKLTGITNAEGIYSSRSYDAVGNITSWTDGNSHVKTHAYDAMNRLINVVDASGSVYKLDYGGTGEPGVLGNNVIAVTDGNGNVTRSYYDLANRPSKTLYSDGTSEQYTYDAEGNVKSLTTRAGQVVQCEYDSRGKQTSAIWSDATPAERRSFDPAGRITEVASSISTIKYTYDNAGGLLGETQSIAGFAGGPKVVSFTSSPDSRRASVTYPQGLVIRHSYSSTGKVATITANDPPPLASYSYNLRGDLVLKTMEDGTTASRTYSAAGNLLSLIHKRGQNVLSSESFGYDPHYRRTWRKGTDGRGDVYAYDQRSQVSRATYDALSPDQNPTAPSRVVQYSYDLTGNRTSVKDDDVVIVHLTNNINVYSSVGNSLLQYDGNGNLLSFDSHSFSYDAQNRVTSLHNAQGIVTCKYDSLGRCVERTTNGVTTYLIYDGWRLLEEYDASGVCLRQYIHGPEDDEILAVVTPTGTFYHHHDSLGSVSFLSNSAGAVLEKYRYDVFGGTSIFDTQGLQIAESALGNRFLYAGREALLNTEIYDFRNRIYSTSLGRFLQRDPIQFQALDVNLYRYVNNCALTQRDPSGLKGKKVGDCCDFIVSAGHGNPMGLLRPDSNNVYAAKHGNRCVAYTGCGANHLNKGGVGDGVAPNNQRDLDSPEYGNDLVSGDALRRNTIMQKDAILDPKKPCVKGCKKMTVTIVCQPGRGSDP